MEPAWLKIVPAEPLVIGGSRTNAHFLATLRYIPARALRGAWAQWLTLHGRETEILSHLDGVRIGNFLPVAEWQTVRHASPFLMSALTCKRAPGFLTEPRQSRRGHGVVDTLIPNLAYELLQAQGAAFAVPFTLTCRECEDRLEPVEGFYGVYQSLHGDERYVQVRQRYHSQTKVALSRRRRTAVDGMLYTITALSPEATHPDADKATSLAFLGRVYAPPQKLNDLLTALNAVTLGALRGRGYGRVKAEVTAAPALPDLADRLERFNGLLVQAWDDLRALSHDPDAVPKQPSGIYFSVDLLAPGIFRQHGLPSLVPQLRVADRLLTPVFWLTRPDFASGWSTAWGLPKPTRQAARAGSVYVFHWGGTREVLQVALEHLEAVGIGEQTEEGFGECLVCHPFHQEVTER